MIGRFKSSVAVAGSLALGIAVLAEPAAGQSFTPAPTSVEFRGSVTVDPGINYACDLAFTVNVDSAGNAAVSGEDLAPGDFFCGFLLLPYGTWAIEPGPGTNAVTLSFGFDLLGDACFDTVVLPFTGGSTAQIAFNTVTLAPVFPNTQPCAVDGAVESDGPLSIF
jgi:hypothetical protein